jgi:hypothetical protein
MDIKEHTIMMVEFWKDVTATLRNNVQLRSGQVISNLMSELDKDVFEKACAKGLDPFYQDIYITDFLEFCQDEMLKKE